MRELLDESYLSAPGLADLAASAECIRCIFRASFASTIASRLASTSASGGIEHASELLSKSAMPLAEIASTCGFSDQSHFCALFKKHSGLTPAKFRDLSGAAALKPTASYTHQACAGGSWITISLRNAAAFASPSSGDSNESSCSMEST